MRYRVLPLIVSAAFLVACAGGSGDMTLPTSSPAVTQTDNPPPPLLNMTAFASLQTSIASGRAANTTNGLLSLDATADRFKEAFSFEFRLKDIEFNANEEQTRYFMSFPRNGDGTPIIVQENGHSEGKGKIWTFDTRNDGFWLIDLAQFTVEQNVFAPCAEPIHPDCVELTVPLVAHFIRFNKRGKIILDIPAVPTPLRFATEI
jgi:hypothetical protein